MPRAGYIYFVMMEHFTNISMVSCSQSVTDLGENFQMRGKSETKVVIFVR